MLRVALREPVAVGLNVTLKVQLAPDARLVPQVVVLVKSAALVPVMLPPFSVKVPLPLFVMVTVCGVLLVPTAWFPKFTVLGDT